MNGDATAPATTYSALPPKLPPAPALTRVQAAAALTAGVVGAVGLPGHEPGLGLALTWTVIAVAVLATRPVESWGGGWRRTTAGVIVAAAALPALSDAGWVVAPVLLAAIGGAVLALAGGGTWLGLARSVLRCVLVGLGSFGAMASAVRSAVPGDARRHPGVRAALLTVVLVGGFGALFASADRVFGSLVDRYLVPEVDLGLLPARLVVAALIAVGAATLVRLRARSDDDRPPPPARRLGGVEWQAPLAALALLFAGFVALQFGVLFGGHQRVLQTAGLTYAEYARGGFAQLVVVAILTLAVIAATVRYTRVEDARQERIQRALLAALCLLTLVVLASAFHRLAVYEDAFGATRLRFGAQAIIWWLGAVFVLVLAVGAIRRTRVLPRGVTLLTAVAVVGVGYLHPDALIAERNVQRYLAEGRIDVDYLADLSADAVPALLGLPDEVRGCVLRPQVARLTGEQSDTWAGWNRSRARAGRLLDAAGPLPPCDEVGRWG